MKAIDLEVQYMYYLLIGEQKYTHKEIIQIIQIYNQLMKILYLESIQ